MAGYIIHHLGLGSLKEARVVPKECEESPRTLICYEIGLHSKLLSKHLRSDETNVE